MALNSNRNLYVEVHDMLFNLNAFLRIKNITTGSTTKKHFSHSLIIKEQDRFFKSLPSMIPLSRVKALILSLHEFEDILPTECYAFRKRSVEFCQKHGIFCFFAGEALLCPLGAILHTQTMINEGNGIMVVRPYGLDSNVFAAFKVIREKGCYRVVAGDPSLSPEECQKTFMANFHPKKFFIVGNKDLRSSVDKIIQQLYSRFKDYNPLFLDLDDKEQLYADAVITKIQHFLGEKLCKFDVAIPSEDAFDVRIDNRKVLWKVDLCEILPYEKSMVIDVGNAKIISVFQESAEIGVNCLKEIKLLSFKTKRVKVTLKIDHNTIPEFTVEEEAVKEEKLPTNPTKARFVFGKQHFSVMIFDENEKEYIVRDSDGLDKTPIYVSFAENKPIVGKTATEAYGNSPRSVVFDLIKLCSVDNAEIMNPKWGFRFFEDDKILWIKMETTEGEKDAEPAFLLALIFKNGLKRISTKTGKKMQAIEIDFDGFSPNEKLKENFVKAAELKEIKILFV